MNPYVIEVMLKVKREEMLQEAEQQRLIAQYEAGLESEGNTLPVVVGNLLIRIGEKLKEKYSKQVELPIA